MIFVESDAAVPDGSAGPPAPARAGAADMCAVRRVPGRPYPQSVRDWVKALYVGTTMTITQIAAETGVARSTIVAWAQQEGWVRPEGAPPLRNSRADRRGRLADRLYHVFGRQLAALEKRAGKGTTDEKDARTLSVLAKTLETLLALDRDDGAKTRPESIDRADYRAELARTLSRWAEEGGRSE